MKWLALPGISLKQITRHRFRSALTVAGVATGMFLYTAVQTMQHSLAAVTQSGADDNTLIVYRENRFCPTTSRLPEHYLLDIQRIEGVSEVIPIQVAVNNCGASLDVITFRGVPPESLAEYNPALTVAEGSFEQWRGRTDGALVGENFARRRGLSPGDTFEAVGVRVYVAGIVHSPLTQDNNVAYVHLSFLQQSSRVGLGVVTQFNVRVDNPELLHSVARRIDELFASDAAPTNTRPEKAFFAQTARDLIEMIAFTRWLGLGAVLAVLGLVANALLLAARGRIKEGAILQTLGFPRIAVGLIMIWEGAILGLLGGMAGCLSAVCFFRFKSFTLGNEGLTLALVPNWNVTVSGLVLAITLGLIASVWPAIVASTKPVVSSLRQG
ncbi:ABC transporter permease [Cerasicoccus arenae]|uniref:ABC transporter substrate-binding protein n=1 Tax=Cerasicoccus arenae TaxID=424488 RepID=A0A8J3GCQ2_9BACT|nr:ABC transporter permease [Cerasicoccus arenae]MBK1857270.1 ABC transporter permease [Cerasicoccus arenae]GHC00384.1 ABC transporter substrate-binding protein [Cerasicoccus arenae]